MPVVVGIGQDGTYGIDVACTNCDWKGSVNIQRGYPLRSKACPMCGCATLKSRRYSL